MIDVARQACKVECKVWVLVLIAAVPGCMLTAAYECKTTSILESFCETKPSCPATKASRNVPQLREASAIIHSARQACEAECEAWVLVLSAPVLVGKPYARGSMQIRNDVHTQTVEKAACENLVRSADSGDALGARPYHRQLRND